MPDGVTFSSQSQIDAFIQDHPYCVEIGGDVTVSGGSITDLMGLQQIELIDGKMHLHDNQGLQGLAGLSKLKTINKSFEIHDNNALIDCNGLDQLSTVNGDLKIWNNPELSDLAGLSALRSIGGHLIISTNNSLKGLDGLDSIAPASIEKLFITENEELDYCHVQSICSYLVNPAGSVDISGNAPGCADSITVRQSCPPPIGFEEIDKEDSGLALQSFPNPFSGEVTLEYTIPISSDIEICFYDYLGNQIDIIQLQQSPGSHLLKWDSKTLPAGMYFCLLKTADGTRTVKIVKM
jgi:hypothetical protein